MTRGTPAAASALAHHRDTPCAAPFWPLVPAALLFVVGVAIFAGVQSVWIDETTQLSGASLSVPQVIRWLAGQAHHDFGVPPDRMPPLSYIVDMVGWHLWGSNPLAFRLYHALIAALGCAVLMIAVGRRFGSLAMLVTGLILALSPKVVATAVEIRAYPLFFAISCVQVAMLIEGGIAKTWRRSGQFLILSIAACYTHFFGLVSGSAFFVATILSARDKDELQRAILCFVALLASAAGLGPFVLGARAISNTSVAIAPDSGSVASFPLKLLGGPEFMVRPAVAVLYFAGMGCAFLAAFHALVRRARGEGLMARTDARFRLIAALAAGIGATVAASFVIKGFNPLGPRYGIWTLPAFAALAGAGLGKTLGEAGRVAGLARATGLACLGLGATGGYVMFLAHAAFFTHGPNRSIEQVLTRAEGPVAVLHVGPGWSWGYFPLRWRHGEQFPQWLLAEDGTSVVRIGSGGDVTGQRRPLSSLQVYRSLVVNRIELADYRELRTFLDASRLADRTRAALAALPQRLPGYVVRNEIFIPGSYAAAVRLDIAADAPGTPRQRALLPARITARGTPLP